MKKTFPAIVLIALMTFTPASLAFSKTLEQSRDFSELEKVVLAELREKNTPGAAVAIVKDNKIVFAKGFGVANVETRMQVTPDTLFQIGSITKSFIATALLTLAAEGKLKLDVPIGNYVKGLSPKIANVTLHHLLSHTSGMLLVHHSSFRVHHLLSRPA